MRPPRFAASRRHWPARRRGGFRPPQADVGDIRRRLAYAQHVFETIDLFVAPSQALADEFVRLGIDAARIEVSDYGFAPAAPMPRNGRQAGLPLRIGFVGTLVWHKGAHMLLEAARGLAGQFRDPRAR